MNEPTDPMRQPFVDGEAYAREVNAVLESMGGDCTSPQWAEYCAKMDQLRGL